MIHTVSVTFSPTKEQFNNFANAEGTQAILNNNGYYDFEYNRFSEIGITKIKGIYLVNKTFTSYLFVARLNLKRLIEQGNRIAVFTEKDTEDVTNAFNAAIKTIHPTMPEFSLWRVSRIDYCYNLYTPYVEEYIRLLQKSDIPPQLHIPKAYDRNRHLVGHRKGSLYLVCNAYTINFYNKADEVQNSHGQQDTDAENVLRLEVQCKPNRTAYMKQKYCFDTKYIHHYLNAEIATETILKALRQVTHGGDYKRHSEALRAIDGIQCTDYKKQQLREIIDTVAKQHSSIAKARGKVNQSRTVFNKNLRLLAENNINAVTIPDNTKLIGKPYREGLTDLITLFQMKQEQDTEN